MIQVLDKRFSLLVSETEIQAQVQRVAAEITRDYEGKKPLFVCVLNGSFMFASDLMKELAFPCEITFVKNVSYCGTESSGKVNKLIGLDRNIENRHVVIVEDIVDTGLTMRHLKEELEAMKPASLRIATCTFKPESLKCPLEIDYVGLSVSDLFLVGYGLDYNGYGRNYKDIYVIAE